MDKTRRLSEMLLQRYPDAFGTDYEQNKKKVDEVALVSSKQLRNHIAGYITRSLKADEPEGPSAEEPKAE